jgi:hypothetical protein
MTIRCVISDPCVARAPALLRPGTAALSRGRVRARWPAGERLREALQPWRRSALLTLIAVPLTIAGCATDGGEGTPLVARPNMQFAEWGAFAYSGRLWQQTEPGTALSGGAQAAACSSCK